MRKELYALARKNCICTRCGSRKAEKGKSACRPCLDYIKSKHEEYRLKKNPNSWKARTIRAEAKIEEIKEEVDLAKGHGKQISPARIELILVRDENE